MIGVLMSATLPARLGEPARALALARRTGRMRETFPVLLGTLVSQTMLNLVALALLGVIIVSTTPLFHSGTQKLFVFSLVPLLLLVVVLVAPVLMRRNGNGRLARIGAALHRALIQVRAGLAVFRDPAPRHRSPRPPSSAPGRSSSPPAGRCSTRSALTARPESAPPPRSSSRSTSPPSCRRPRRTSASSSSR